MSQKSLFEYAVLHHITDDEGEVTDTKLLVEKNIRLESDEKVLAAKIYRELPESVIEDLENVQIIIRPF